MAEVTESKKPVKLDARDRKILRELDIDSRGPLSSIGKKLKLPKTVVSYRISRLVDEGLITKFCAIINQSLLGYRRCRISIKFQYLSSALEKEFIAFLKGRKNIYWVARTDNLFDFCMIMLYKDISDVSDLNSEIIYSFGKHMLNHDVTFIAESFYLRNNFIYDEMLYDVTRRMRPDKPIRLDETDYRLINTLKDDARISLLDLSKRLSMNHKTVSSRIKKLTDDTVIMAYRAVIDRKLLGFHHFRVFFTLFNLTKEKERQIISYLCQMKPAILVEKGLSRWNLEFEVLLKNHFELYDLMEHIKRRFPDNIQTYDFILVYEVYPINTVTYSSFV